MSEQALSGVQVLDCTRGIAGSYCTKLLADFGAEVIKVEDPNGGDPLRNTGPFLKDEPHSEKSGPFFYLNTNKKSITLNLRSETGVKIFKELVKEADVLVESFPPGTMTELGLDYEILSELNPQLIMTSISGFGQTGPYRNYKASNLVLSGLGGTMYTSRPANEPQNRPVVQGGFQAEHIAGLESLIATVAALFNRIHTNRGTWIDVSAMECVASTLTGYTGEYSNLGLSRKTSPLPIQGHPGLCNYRCKDGWINPTPGLGAASNIAFLIDKPEMQDDPLLANPAARIAAPEKVDALLLPWCMEHDKWTITKKAQELRLCFTPILSPKELAKDEQLEARDFFNTAGHPVMGKVTYPGALAKLSDTPPVAGKAPMLGENNHEIYERLGYVSEDVVKLQETGII